MIAFDAREKMNAKAFDLIGTDAGKNRGANGGDIAVDEFIAERAASQSRARDRLEGNLPGPGNADGRQQMMAAPRKPRELHLGFAQIARFGEDHAVKRSEER